MHILKFKNLKSQINLKSWFETTGIDRLCRYYYSIYVQFCVKNNFCIIHIYVYQALTIRQYLLLLYDLHVNWCYAGLPSSTIEPLQRVLNAAARLVLNLRPSDHITPALQQLHWLPIESRITYKLCLIMQLVHTNRAPQYRADCVRTTAQSSSRPGLRSADTASYVKPCTRTKFGDRGFRSTGPATWNSLPDELHRITE